MGVQVPPRTPNSIYGGKAGRRQLRPALRCRPANHAGIEPGRTHDPPASKRRTGHRRPHPQQAEHGHCITPAYIDYQLAHNTAELRRPRLDLLYLHTPEHGAHVDRDQLLHQIRGAFEVCEQAVHQGRITGYGVATWSGFSSDVFTVPELLAVAQQAADGSKHHFTAIQLPVSLVHLAPLTQALNEDGPIGRRPERARGMSVRPSQRRRTAHPGQRGTRRADRPRAVGQRRRADRGRLHTGYHRRPAVRLDRGTLARRTNRLPTRTATARASPGDLPCSPSLTIRPSATVRTPHWPPRPTSSAVPFSPILPTPGARRPAPSAPPCGTVTLVPGYASSKSLSTNAAANRGRAPPKPPSPSQPASPAPASSHRGVVLRALRLPRRTHHTYIAAPVCSPLPL